MRPDTTPSPVNLLLVCKELRKLRNDESIPAIERAAATLAFKSALRSKLGFPPEVLRWDDTAIEMYLEIIISAG
jgi:hypothetical protein